MTIYHLIHIKTDYSDFETKERRSKGRAMIRTTETATSAIPRENSSASEPTAKMITADHMVFN